MGVPRIMGCDVIDKIVNRGFKQGFEEGMEQAASLFRKLLAQNRIEDLKKACKDRQYFMQLLKEFGID